MNIRDVQLRMDKGKVPLILLYESDLPGQITKTIFHLQRIQLGKFSNVAGYCSAERVT